MEEKKNISGLQPPEGYFENFEDRMMLKVMEDSLPKSNGFKVPEDYFGQFEGRMIDAISETDAPKVVSLFRKQAFWYAAAIAASLALIVSLYNGFGSELSIEDLSASAVEEYIDEGGMGIDSYDVIALLEEEDINELTIPSDEISEESLENYLIENIDETSLLIE
ncbi:MAG: hypothetical protein KJO05_12170 [Bacteroidia bacterium]|nr:hypothetical protein [Bacteroidia bacterium]MBT8274842.1 hypothetical protein [Bacteroidia bacterium]NNK54596.1 hypothetical protein [Flavobacteriaceae bacterium]NNM09548.1 hypothetical protein [Flavobacteriaceae bacterium]